MSPRATTTATVGPRPSRSAASRDATSDAASPPSSSARPASSSALRRRVTARVPARAAPGRCARRAATAQEPAGRRARARPRTPRRARGRDGRVPPGARRPRGPRPAGPAPRPRPRCGPHSPARRAPSSMRPPPCWTALATRLPIAWASRTRSPRTCTPGRTAPSTSSAPRARATRCHTATCSCSSSATAIGSSRHAGRRGRRDPRARRPRGAARGPAPRPGPAGSRRGAPWPRAPGAPRRAARAAHAAARAMSASRLDSRRRSVTTSSAPTTASAQPVGAQQRHAASSSTRRHRVEEPVADTPHVHDVAVAVHPELAPQPARVRVDRARPAHAAIAPDRAQQLLLRPHPRRLDREHAQESELLRRQLDLLAAQQHGVRGGIDLQRPGADASQRAPRARPAQQRVDPGPQLGVAERLAQVVVGAALEAAQAIDLPCPAGQQHDRRARVHAAGDAVRRPQPPQDLEPREIGKPQVEQQEVGCRGLQQAQGVSRAVAGEHLVAVGGEVVGEERAGRVVVLDDEDGGGVVGHAPTRRRARRSRRLSSRSRRPRSRRASPTRSQRRPASEAP